MTDSIIAQRPPPNWLDYDVQCARCGSSVWSDFCWQCDGEGTVGHECGDDTCCCLNPEDNVLCQMCEGQGRIFACMLSPEWCRANPLPNREPVLRGSLEWFVGGDR